jgi:drug/metabolite transporter (DMT)-like permease
MAPNSNQSQRNPANLAKKAADTGRLPKKARKPFAIALLIVAISTSFGNILIKYSFQDGRAPTVNSIADLPKAALSVLTNIWLILAIILLITEFIALIYAMRLGPLSLVIPLRGAATYIVTAILAYYFLGEVVTPERWAALILILIGVVMIGLTGGEDA